MAHVFATLGTNNFGDTNFAEESQGSASAEWIEIKCFYKMLEIFTLALLMLTLVLLALIMLALTMLAVISPSGPWQNREFRWLGLGGPMPKGQRPTVIRIDGQSLEANRILSGLRAITPLPNLWGQLDQGLSVIFNNLATIYRKLFLHF